MTVLSLSLCLLAACANPFKSEEPTTPKGMLGYVPGALGVISVEEPQAALIARDILSAGGTAADAATAVAFALTVTLPSSASIAGGGVCIARDSRGAKPVVIDFLPRASVDTTAGVERPSAVPGLPRGMFLLHSRFGELKWERVLSPAENLARFGFNTTRAFSSEYSKVADVLLRDPAMARIFAKKNGEALAEGDFLVQPDLAGVLGRIRIRGAGDLYLGNEAKHLVEAVHKAGGTLTVDEMRDYKAEVRDPISVKYEQNTVWQFAGPPAAVGAVTAEMMALLMKSRHFEKANPALREHLLAEAAKRAFVDHMNNLQEDGTYRQSADAILSEGNISKLSDGIDDDRATPIDTLIKSPVDWPESPAAVSFSVMDVKGGAVACTLTMNNLFGTGRVAEGFGMVLAAAPDKLGRTYTPVGPVLLTSELDNRVFLAAAASGGVTAPTALANVLARAAAGPQSLQASMNAPRTHYAGVPDKVFVEPDMPAETIEALRKRGHDVVVTKSIGRVTAVYCPSGLPVKKNLSCSSANDERGYGIAIGGI